jgi:hypothetical protein
MEWTMKTTISTTFKASVAALALGAMTLGAAALSPAAAGNKHGGGFNLHGHGHFGHWNGGHLGIGFGHYYPGFYVNVGPECFWDYRKVFIPHVGFVVKKERICY